CASSASAHLTRSPSSSPSPPPHTTSPASTACDNPNPPLPPEIPRRNKPVPCNPHHPPHPAQLKNRARTQTLEAPALLGGFGAVEARLFDAKPVPGEAAGEDVER